MATTQKLVAGAASAWSSLMTTDLNSLASGNAVLYSGSAIDNGANDDLFVEFSFITGGSITPTGSPFAAVYVYRANGDATPTYGDGRFASAAAGPPPTNYLAGVAGLPAAAGTQSGSFALPGDLLFPLPRGLWKPVFYNACGVTLPASGNVLYYRTVNFQFA